MIYWREVDTMWQVRAVEHSNCRGGERDMGSSAKPTQNWHETDPRVEVACCSLVGPKEISFESFCEMVLEFSASNSICVLLLVGTGMLTMGNPRKGTTYPWLSTPSHTDLISGQPLWGLINTWYTHPWKVYSSRLEKLPLCLVLRYPH